MATVAFHIRSEYDPEDRERLEVETGQIEEETIPTNNVVDPEQEWRQEVAKLPSQRPRRAAPQFVPATATFDEWSPARQTTSQHRDESGRSLGNSLSGWYRSLTNTQTHTSDKLASSSRVSYEILPSSQNKTASSTVALPRTSKAHDKNAWFIRNAIDSEPSTTSTTPTPAPSLADILARDPPPLPSQSQFTPPVFLEIGPSNKGYNILQRSGWNEGEALGPDVVRRKPVKDILPDEEIIPTMSSAKGKGKSRHMGTISCTANRRMVEVKFEDDVSELRSVDVIDLTLSDSDESEDDEGPHPDSPNGDVKVEEDIAPRPETSDSALEDPTYGRRALITPIATVLKSDRLGIGLKAKTTGPYKESRKRVTHNAAALAAHTKVAEESRLRAKRFGRGRRGFEKQHRREEETRKAMLHYLKGGL
ncbi:hypothetical protein D9613_005898 [Agrocybe pediades]|uniref:G-patch domain-containing protein n=1 Tax=Agrocybe pediades TaxID=84607 RepID=A0A8H4QVT4_9AGAR|nr:hypothetical protein D9613_005898 [Agrocybe pediades]